MWLFFEKLKKSVRKWKLKLLSLIYDCWALKFFFLRILIHQLKIAQITGVASIFLLDSLRSLSTCCIHKNIFYSSNFSYQFASNYFGCIDENLHLLIDHFDIVPPINYILIRYINVKYSINATFACEKHWNFVYLSLDSIIWCRLAVSTMQSCKTIPSCIPKRQCIL